MKVKLATCLSHLTESSWDSLECILVNLENRHWLESKMER